jgi:hypothetical protein
MRHVAAYGGVVEQRLLAERVVELHGVEPRPHRLPLHQRSLHQCRLLPLLVADHTAQRHNEGCPQALVHAKDRAVIGLAVGLLIRYLYRRPGPAEAPKRMVFYREGYVLKSHQPKMVRLRLRALSSRLSFHSLPSPCSISDLRFSPGACLHWNLRLRDNSFGLLLGRRARPRRGAPFSPARTHGGSTP